MTVFDIVKKNIKGNIQNYLLYFISFTISVIIFYTFVSLQDTPEIQVRTESFEIIRSIIFQASFLLILFVGVFIWYSHSFFTKRRKKEVGLYALLGIRKKTIGKMLFYENLILGLSALLIGILLGVLLSRLFVMLLLKLLDAPMDIAFHLSFDAILYTSIVFGCMITLTSIQAYRLVYRFKLIALFQAEKQREQTPKSSVLFAIVSMVLLACSFLLVYQSISNDPIVTMGLFSFFTIVGTYLLYRSAVMFLLKAVQNNKPYFYRGTNLIGYAHVLHRIQGNTRTLTIISLLSAATLTAFYMGYSEYNNIKKNAVNYAPFSYQYTSNNEAFDHQVKKIIEQDKEHPVLTQLEIPVIQMNGDISAFEYIPYGHPVNKTPIRILSCSTYHLITMALGKKDTLHLSKNQAAMIRPYLDYTNSNNIGKKLTLQGSYTLSIVKTLEDRIINWSDPDIYIVISDSLFKGLKEQKESFYYKIYRVKDQEATRTTSNQLLSLAADKKIELSTFYRNYRMNIESAGVDLFLLGFLGIVFIVATGSIIYLKQLMEAYLDRERYHILQKIGTTKREITIAITKQTLFVYLLPLVIGILHSTMIYTILSPNGEVFTMSVLTSIMIYVFIYSLYYVWSVYSYKKIVTSR
jgi:putative ABC transport system permease protein